MAKDPAFLFYSKDFLTGIQDLTMEERGQYITLLCIQHQKGHMSDKLIGLSVGNAAADVMAKFRQDPAGLWYNERLELESEKRKAHSEKQSKRAAEGWQKRKNEAAVNTTANAAALPLVNGNVNGDYITIGALKIFDVMKVLELKQAALNARQKEHGLRSWPDMVPEWFRQNVQQDFKDERHIFNAFSKYIITYGKPKTPEATNTTVRISDQPRKVHA